MDRSLRHFSVTTILLLVFFFVAGCSIFGRKEDGTPTSKAFRTKNKPVPSALPVEIADDITKISTGGDIVPRPQVQAPLSATDGGNVAEPEIAVNRDPQRGPSSVDGDEPTSEPEQLPVKGKGHAKKLGRQKRGGQESYTVRRGDTLMKISFAKYGDLTRWREIFEINRDHIRNFNALAVGTILSIQGVEYVVIEKNGEPYLIRRNDTLGKISRSVYGKPDLWKSIWRNNPQLIKDPNRIYTGFTLYYVAQPAGNSPRVGSDQQSQ